MDDLKRAALVLAIAAVLVGVAGIRAWWRSRGRKLRGVLAERMPAGQSEGF